MKECSKCGVSKGSSEFYGARPDCKSCKKAATNKHYSETSEERVSYSKVRRNKMKLKCIKHLVMSVKIVVRNTIRHAMTFIIEILLRKKGI